MAIGVRVDRHTYAYAHAYAPAPALRARASRDSFSPHESACGAVNLAVRIACIATQSNRDFSDRFATDSRSKMIDQVCIHRNFSRFSALCHFVFDETHAKSFCLVTPQRCGATRTKGYYHDEQH